MKANHIGNTHLMTNKNKKAMWDSSGRDYTNHQSNNLDYYDS